MSAWVSSPCLTNVCGAVILRCTQTALSAVVLGSVRLYLHPVIAYFLGSSFFVYHVMRDHLLNQ